VLSVDRGAREALPSSDCVQFSIGEQEGAVPFLLACEQAAVPGTKRAGKVSSVLFAVTVFVWPAGCAGLLAQRDSPVDEADYGPVRPPDTRVHDSSPTGRAAYEESGPLAEVAEAVFSGNDVRNTPTAKEGGVGAAKAAEPSTEYFERERVLVLALRDRALDAEASERGVTVTLPDAMFEFGSAELTSEARRKIQEVSEVLQREGRGRAIAVEGHTDSIGAELYNQGLSERRADRVAAALIDAGASDSLVSEVGYGSSRPIAPNVNSDGSDSPEGRARNRRVEIVILN
jgi:outer membrane protein OmpA-like peptidoglycan-associated protein